METVQSSDHTTAKSVVALQATNTELQKQVGEYEQRIEHLEHQLDWFKRQLFGEKSEKRLIEDHPNQLSIGDLLKDKPRLPRTTEKQSVTYERNKNHKNQLEGTPKDSGLRFDESVPVKEIEQSAPELSGPDADQYIIISTKTTYRLAQRPGSYVVLKYTRPVVKHKASNKIINVPAPDNVLDKSLADVSFLAGMLVDKFVFHLPLYRQHQKLKMSGIALSRSTLTNLVHRSIHLLKPIYEAQFRSALLSKTLAMDETPIKAGRKKKGKLNTAWYWPMYGDRDEVVFGYSPTRAGQYIKDQLASFSGTLITDGYSAYARFAQGQQTLTHAQCWAHTRRYFEKSKEMEPDAVAVALEFIGQLYQHEEMIRERQLTCQKKLDYRCQYSKPIVDTFFGWCDGQCQRMDLVNSNPLAKAIKYTQARQQALSVYLSDPEVPIDTNHLERALRVIPMGRRNWLFCWTEIGAELVGIIQSLLVTCRLHDINPYPYLVDVLQRVNTHPMAQVDELIPRNWKESFADNPLKSDLNN